MTFFLRAYAPLRPAASRTILRSSFHTSRASWALSETDRDQPDRDAKIDHHKSDSVQKAKEGKGEWKPELSSSSEQAVKGEKHDMSMEEMQKMGKKNAEEGKSPSGSSSS